MVAYVIDTTIVMAYLQHNSLVLAAETLFEQVALTDKLYAPDFCPVEVTNTLWKLVRFAHLPTAEGVGLAGKVLTLPVEFASTLTLMPSALQIGLTHTSTVYDAVYIALAKSLNATFITLDKKQAGVAAAEGVTLQPLADFMPKAGEA